MARPMGVFPRSHAPSQTKCCDHLSRRGLKRGASWSLSGSLPAMFGPFRRLQEKHAHAKFADSLAPMLLSYDVVEVNG